VNFAYYEVFNAFVRLRGTNQVNMSVIDLLKDYYFLIPAYLYLLALILMAVVVTGTIIYFKKHKKLSLEQEIAHLKELYNKINFIGLKRKKKINSSFVLLLIVFILINAVLCFGLYSYKKQASAQGFDRTRYFSDLGISGYILSPLVERVPGFVSDKQKQRLKTGYYEVESKSNIDILRENMESLSLLSNNKESNEIEFEGLEEKPHIIVYQMESVGEWALKQDPSPMPYLSQLMEENISVESFWPNSCTTINAEFSSMCSFYAETLGPVSDLFSNNNYYCLPSLLRVKHDYKTTIYHANSAAFWNREVLAPKWGFEEMHFSPEYNVREDDEILLNDILEQIKESKKPTLSYLIGFTTHSPHNEQFMDNYYNLTGREIEPYKPALNADSLSATQDEETTRIYFGFLKRADEIIKDLFINLEKENLLDKTMVIIYGDHRYYDFKSNGKINDFYNYNQVPLMIYVPGIEKVEVKRIASHIDIAPTILNIIEGKDYQMPKHFVGQSILSGKHPNSAINKCLGESFYIDQNIIINNDMLLGVESPIAFLKEYAKDKFNDYANLFRNVIEKSDEMMIKNILLGDYKNQNEIKIDTNEIADTDKDGLSDLREKAIGTNRKNPDSDGDGILDGVEIMEGSDPLWPNRL